ncbi:MAG: 50S ribosomal protein L4 [Patescibacteria group bacterium]|nr:50S ribosomal protein L4 [Patescibacteria group bacterium]MDD4610519.1 50S ribosomal protein L4 [Patescibacteria group bacterium]
MMKINVYNQNGEQAGTVEVSEKIFGVKVNSVLMHQAVVAQMANERQVLAHTKGRGDVRGGGKKPWKQKGTGRARAGSSRSPIWIGGGVTFGPTKERNFSKKLNKKMRQKAIKMALSEKLSNNNLVIVDKLDIKDFKTKVFNQIIKNIENKIFNYKKDIKRNVLIINNEKDEKVKYSGRNLAGVKMLNLENINIVDLLKYKNYILTKETIAKLEERYK